VPYVPAGDRAAAAVAKSPRKSNVAIAKEIGVGEATVRRARKSTSSHDEVDESRVGLDGKVRKLPAGTRSPRKPRGDRAHAGALKTAWNDATPEARAKFIDGVGVKAFWDAMWPGHRERILAHGRATSADVTTNYAMFLLWFEASHEERAAFVGEIGLDSFISASGGMHSFIDRDPDQFWQSLTPDLQDKIIRAAGLVSPAGFPRRNRGSAENPGRNALRPDARTEVALLSPAPASDEMPEMPDCLRRTAS
jgi:hypothetical protein